VSEGEVRVTARAKRQKAKKLFYNGATLPKEVWGRDHESTMLYIETRCVDYGGVPVAAQMRTCKGRPRRGSVSGRDGALPLPPGDFPTHLADGTELYGHDDWDCVNDLVAAGLLEWLGTGLLPVFRLTDAGWEFVGKLRRAKADRTRGPTLQDAARIVDK